MRFVFGLLAILFAQLVSANSAIDSVCEHSDLNIDRGDCRALVDFYYSFNVSATDLEDSWGSADVSRWKGIKIEANRVHAINLPTSESESLSGEFLESFKNLSELRELNIRGAIYRAALPDFWSYLENLETLMLTARKSDVVNTFPESIQSLKRLKILELGNLKIRSRFPTIWGGLPNLEQLRLHSNLFYGEVDSSIVELKKLNRLVLSRNKFLWGEFPFEILKNDLIEGVFVFESGFWGEIPEFVLDGESRVSSRSYVAINNNHFSNAPEENISIQSEEGRYFLDVFWQSLSENQEDHAVNIEIELGENGSVALAPKIVGERSKIFIVPDEGYKANAIMGCKGELLNGVFSIDPNQTNCVAEISFSRCQGEDCVVDLGATNNISNISVESPSSKFPLSGVAQLRGWMNTPDWDNKFNQFGYFGERATFSISIDGGERQYYSHLDSRSDVRDAMGEQWEVGKQDLGWSVPVYSGNLDNGLHTIDIFNAIGLHVASRVFQVFNPKTNGKVEYIHNVERALSIENFPVLGHTSEIAFNIAEQKFSVINQFDGSGNSLRSEERHSRSEEERYSNSYLRQKSSRAGDRQVANIENPSKGMILSGVQSLRGWFVGTVENIVQDNRYFYYSGKSIEVDLGGDSQILPLHFHERKDVNDAFSAKGSNGWSILWYSGLLKNGWHTIDIGAYEYAYTRTRYVIQEVDFLSFTPLNENGEQFYVRSYDRDVLVEDFPYQGSDVTLRFDPAGQNFVIVDQIIH
ncbi:hypothetical protein [uncultured Pseudoteredinibacter sp.]|uniref:leucine-rich repeat domain-containing protein n=1 Tax=uncultured Pseudoteredinibacter sp. TaxID=1641701 RepID=UPI00260A4339|nr:hypothetical protein [uncultured Pseudoteredinibacter sp.]